MKPYNLNCKICEKEFGSLESLHKHVKKHNLILAQYYTTYYPRKNKLTGEILPFKNVDSYFEKDFTNRSQMNKWLEIAGEEKAKQYIESVIIRRVYEKERKFLPFHFEIQNCFLPSIDLIKKYFGSYSFLSQQIGIPLLFNKAIPNDFFKQQPPHNVEIIVDTREQKPLPFSFKTKKQKLYFADYCIGGEYYDYTYVDRKSGQDFTGTMLGDNYDRFRREIQRAKEMDSYIFVVVESTIPKIIAYNKKFKRKATIDFILKRARDLMYEFPKNCQFIFTGSRANSSVLIPKILYHGKKLWNVDLQYFIDYELGNRQSKKTEKLSANK